MSAAEQFALPRPSRHTIAGAAFPTVVSVLLLVTLALFVPWPIQMVVVVFASARTLLSFSATATLVSRCRAVPATSPPEVFTELAAASGLPPGSVVLRRAGGVDAAMAIEFSDVFTGRHAVLVSSPVLTSPSLLTPVLYHEFAHITLAHWWPAGAVRWAMSCAFAALVTVPWLLINSGATAVLAVVFAVAATVGASVVCARDTEFAADVAAVELGCDPEQLAAALESIDARHLWWTHPSQQSRAAALRALDVSY